MKTMIIFLILISSQILWAKPVVLVSYYDVFGRAKFNNSENVAKALSAKLGGSELFELKLCPIPTSYKRGYVALENCIKALSTPPLLYLGLGEFGCSIKMETMTRNLDKNLVSPDNDGELRDQEIIPNAPKIFSMNHPAAEMYCATPKSERDKFVISNNAGSFVCNHTAYEFSHFYQEIPSGFMHVPANNCQNLEALTAKAVENLDLMLKAAVSTLVARNGEGVRLPLTKKELGPLRTDQMNQESGLY
jgi:pyrrolidone-carboxylate peptidase